MFWCFFSFSFLLNDIYWVNWSIHSFLFRLLIRHIYAVYWIFLFVFICLMYMSHVPCPFHARSISILSFCQISKLDILRTNGRIYDCLIVIILICRFVPSFFFILALFGCDEWRWNKRNSFHSRLFFSYSFIIIRKARNKEKSRQTNSTTHLRKMKSSWLRRQRRCVHNQWSACVRVLTIAWIYLLFVYSFVIIINLYWECWVNKIGLWKNFDWLD